MIRKKCEGCGGALQYVRADSRNTYYKCPSCGELFSFSTAGDSGANLIFENTKHELLSRLRRGFEDWRATQWDQLYRDLVAFAGAHEHLQSDLQFQMAIVACMTKGFNSMEAETYQQCKTLFKITDKMYKAQLKEAKAKANNPELCATIGEYEASRAKFVKLHNEYVNSKMPWKIIH